MDKSALRQLITVAREFAIDGRFLAGAPYGTGHINDTFAVALDRAGTRVRYIFQRINHRVFPNVPALMENIRRVTAHVSARSAGASLTLVPTRDGRPCFQDPSGFFWRCYPFIEGARSYDIVAHPRQAYEAARAFGAFQRLLSDLPGGRLHETIPRFHDTRARFEAFRRAVSSDPAGRAASVRPEIEFALARESMADVLLRLQSAGRIPERIVHNDTKIGNILLDDSTGRAVCVIDLDTVMPGLALHDFGDMVRSATNSAAEDETDLARVAMRLPVYEQLVAGYLAGAGALLNPDEREHLAFAGKLIPYENGMRFLADHLEGDVYYKIQRPGHNLDRARNQFALVRSIERQEDRMRSVTERLLASPS